MASKSVRFISFDEKPYQPISENSDTESLLQNDMDTSPDHGTDIYHRHLSPVLIAFVLFAACLTSLTCGTLLGRRYPSHNGALRHVSKYTPIMDDIAINFHTEQFNGTFVHENIYRQGPGPEVDAAWDALGVRYRNIIVPKTIARQVEFRPHDHMQINEKYGGGYPAFVEGLHQLHCLNLLRQALYYNYDYYHAQGKDAFSDPEDVQRWHVSHCLDFIRQRLMCTVDIGVFGSVWVNKTEPKPFVDFNTKHTCRDFDAVRQWAEEHQQPEDPPDDWILPPGEDMNVLDLAP